MFQDSSESGNVREHAASWHKNAKEGDKAAKGHHNRSKSKSYSTRRHFFSFGQDRTGIFADAVVQLEQLRKSQLECLSNVSGDVYVNPLSAYCIWKKTRQNTTYFIASLHHPFSISHSCCCVYVRFTEWMRCQLSFAVILSY